MRELTRQIGPLAIAGGQQAMKVVRQPASQWGLAPARIGMIGFSAGGRVTVGVALEHDAESRPNFAAPIYGALWEDLAVPADAPPLFIALANDDELAVDPGIALYCAWRAAGHPVELHIYAQGGHGFGMRKQGLLVCACCGYAYYGKPISPSARKGHPRKYAYYRCIGSDAYRFGGVRLCWNKQLRTDLVDEAVWEEVCRLLSHPERLEQEYRRRLLQQEQTPDELSSLETRMGRVRQGLARLIDSYAEGLIDKTEFEPRMTRMRERLQHMEAHAQQARDEASLERELTLILGRLDAFATRVKTGLHEADWLTRREIIRALVKRVEIDQEQVRVVFRVNPPPHTPQPPSEKDVQSLQHCRGRGDPTLRRSMLRCVEHLLLDVSRFQPLFDKFLAGNWANDLQEIVVCNVVERPFDVGVEHPFLGLVWSSQNKDFLDGVVTASAWSKSVARTLESGFPGRLKGVLDHCLKAAVDYDGDSKRPQLVVGFRYVDATRWFGFPEGVMGAIIDHPSTGSWRFKHQLIHPRRVLASVDLCYSSDADKPIGVTFQHELLEGAYLLLVALLCRPKDAMSQVTNSSVGFAPLNGVPIGLLLGSVC